MPKKQTKASKRETEQPEVEVLQSNGSEETQGEERKVVLDETSIDQFDPTVAELQGLVAKTKDLVVADLENKEQLEVVRTSRIALKKKRVDIEKYAKTLRDTATAWSRKVSAKEKELIGIIEPEEDRLAAIESEAEKLALRKAQMEKLPIRKERLAQIGDEEETDDEELILMDANQFEAYYNSRVAAKLRADKEKAEADQRLRDEEMRRENERKEEELAEERRKLDLERQKLAEERRILGAEKQDAVAPSPLQEEEAQEEDPYGFDRKETEEKVEKDLDKASAYRKFRADHGWTPETSREFKEENTGAEIVLWRRVGQFKFK